MPLQAVLIRKAIGARFNYCDNDPAPPMFPFEVMVYDALNEGRRGAVFPVPWVPMPNRNSWRIAGAVPHTAA